MSSRPSVKQLLARWPSLSMQTGSLQAPRPAPHRPLRVDRAAERAPLRLTELELVAARRAARPADDDLGDAGLVEKVARHLADPLGGDELERLEEVVGAGVFQAYCRR